MLPDVDRRGLFAIAVVLVFAIGAIIFAGYLGSQAPKTGGRAPLAAVLSPPVSPTPITTPSPSPSPSASGKSIAFLGDSWTLGAGTTCGPQCGFAELTAARLGMKVSEDAVAGTGYANGGGSSIPGPDRFSTRLAHFESLSPDIAVIAGGQNDASFVQATVQTAAATLIAKLKQDLPKATIVVIGPFSANGQTSPQLLATRDAIQSAAKASGVGFIDPISENWITGVQGQASSGNAAQYISADGVNPNTDGYKYLADRLTADLRQLGVG